MDQQQHKNAQQRINSILAQITSNGVSADSNKNVESQQTDDKKNLHGGMNAAKALKEQNVKAVFTLTGGHISPILVGCSRIGIRVVDVRDEATTVFAADAVSRITGIPGVAIVTAGPGLTNTITAVKNAQMAQSPLVIFCGATATILKGRGSLQDIDQFSLMKPHVKSFESITSVKEIIPVIRRAFKLSQEGVPGPTCVEFPLDTIWPQSFTMSTLGLDKPLKPLQFNISSLTGRAKDLYLAHHFNTMFKGAFDPLPALTTTMVLPVQPDSSQINQVAKALSTSKRPLILLGSQAVRANGVSAIVKSVESLGLPIFLSGMGRGLLGKSHPLQMRHKRGQALAKADFILLLGVPADFRLEYGKHINNQAFFVTVNLCPITLRKNNDIRNPNIRVHGDSIVFLQKLSEISPSFKAAASPSNDLNRYKEWFKFLNALQDQREKEIDAMANADSIPEVEDDNKNFVNPIRLLRTIDNVMEDNAIIVADGGDFVGTASYIVRPRGPLSWLDPGVFGTLGVGAGFALGAKQSSPNSPIWLIYGDGASGWGLTEIDTMVRMKLPAIMIIGNDACWSQMFRDQVRLLESDVACLLSFTRYDLVAEGFGAKGILVRRESQMKAALEEAAKIAAQGTPVVVNCLIARSKFREGSISL